MLHCMHSPVHQSQKKQTTSTLVSGCKHHSLTCVVKLSTHICCTACIHQFINHSTEAATFLVVGTKAAREVATYSDVDLIVTMQGGQATFTHKNGTPYGEQA